MEPKLEVVELASSNDDGEASAIFEALSHRLRRRILRLMMGAESPPMSPKKIADALAEPLANISYHVRVLADCGAVELVERTPQRGSLEHFYLPAKFTGQPWVRDALGIAPRT